MKGLHFSQHAVERLAQRGLAASDIDLIMEIGSEVPDGYIVRTKDRQALEQTLKRLLERVRRLERKRLVVQNGCLVTAYRSSSRNERRLLRGAAEGDLRQRQVK